MPNKTTVSHYVTLQRGITYKGNLVGKPGPALLGLGSIHPGGGFREGEYKTYGGECPPKIMLGPGDLFVSLKGATKDGKMIGSIARVPTSVKSGRLTQDTVKLDFLYRDQETENFLYWVLRTPQYRDYCAGRATGSAVVALSRDDFLSYPIPVFTATRRRIVQLLEAVEAKIELNRRMNATLEAMARALFRSWFVDFDPVRARMDGRPLDLIPGADAETASLFPDAFKDSPLGAIPKGWEVTKLGDACERGGGSIQTGPFGSQLHASDYVEDGIPSIMPSDLRDNRIDVSSIAQVAEEDAERLAKYRVQTGDIVYSRRGDVERLSLIRRAENGWLCGTGCLRVRFGPRGLKQFFGACYLGTSDSRAWVVRHAVGATMPNLNTSILEAVPLIVPPADLQVRFAEMVGPWDERGTAALTESRSLAALRDALLPKLLSSKLSVADIEKEASNVA